MDWQSTIPFPLIAGVHLFTLLSHAPQNPIPGLLLCPPMGKRTLFVPTTSSVRVTHRNISHVVGQILRKGTDRLFCGFISALFIVPIHIQPVPCIGVSTMYGRNPILIEAIFADTLIRHYYTSVRRSHLYVSDHI